MLYCKPEHRYGLNKGILIYAIVKCDFKKKIPYLLSQNREFLFNFRYLKCYQFQKILAKSRVRNFSLIIIKLPLKNNYNGRERNEMFAIKR